MEESARTAIRASSRPPVRSMPVSKGARYKPRARVAEEAERAVRLRKLGASYREIGEILGMRVNDVFYRVQRVAPELIRGRQFCEICQQEIGNIALHEQYRHGGGTR